jgi:RHS repeat-associated protein
MITVRSRLKVLTTLAVLMAGTSAYAEQLTLEEMAWRPTAKTLTDTTTITAPYSTNGRTRTWAYSWSTTGKLLSVDGPLSGTGDTTTYTYNANGYLASVTNEVGQTTTISAWDGRGLPRTVVDPNEVTRTLTYDMEGRLLTLTVNPGGSQSQYAFEYNAAGDMTKVTLPEGGYLSYTYDNARRLTLITNDRGQTQTFTNNLKGDPTAVVIKTSGASITEQQNFAYDELGRLIQSIGAGSQTTGFAYDKVDNQTQVTDARGKLFQKAYDALDRVITETNPQSQTVQRAYNGADKLTSHKDGRTLETTRIVDGFGQVIQETSPDRGTLTYWYTAAGKVSKIVDGDSQETDFTYDNAGRLLTSSYVGASAETVTYSYDSTSGGNKGVGRLTGVTEESGSSAFTYDAQGRLTQDVKTIQGRSYTVGYAYDRNAKVTQLTLPSGRTVSFTRASDGLVTAISTKATPSSSSESLASSVTYLPFGPLASLTYGNGLALTDTYDGNYWLTRTEVKATGATRLDLSFNRNANGQLTEVVDNASSGRGATFGYTDAGRLSTAAGPWGSDTYTYDAAGNRTDKARDIGGTVTHETPTIASASNQVTLVNDGSAVTKRNLTYRSGGDLSQDAFVGGSTYTYQYNARKRLVVAKKDSVDAGYYGYDFMGRRVWRSVLGTTTVQSHYVFDPDGRLLAEHDGATGAVVREYVWLDDQPIAMIDSSTGTAQTYFIHAGQIGEPLVMTDSSKAKVWDAYVEAYGKAQVFGTPSAGLDARLPGQWLEAETGGLHQNWYRNYDPSLGRYIEADPLGIGAGQNIYAYVDGRAVEWRDPSGLWTAHGGVTGGINIGSINVNASYTTAVDGHGNIGSFITIGGGATNAPPSNSGGASAYIGGIFGLSSAYCIDDLIKKFDVQGFGGGDGVYVGVNHFSGTGDHGPVEGHDVVIGPGGGANVTIGPTYTWRLN